MLITFPPRISAQGLRTKQLNRIQGAILVRWREKIYFIITESSKPGSDRPRGGEFAADDCWLVEYHGVRDDRPSYESFVGEVAPEVLFGDPAAEYPLGDPAVDITFGVPLGVSRGVIYGVKEKLCPVYLEAVESPKKKI